MLAERCLFEDSMENFLPSLLKKRHMLTLNTPRNSVAYLINIENYWQNSGEAIGR